MPDPDCVAGGDPQNPNPVHGPHSHAAVPPVTPFSRGFPSFKGTLAPGRPNVAGLPILPVDAGLGDR